MKRDAFSLSYFLLIIFYSLFASCKTTAQISRQAEKTLITDTAISKGFIGISVFDPSYNTYLYNYNADKYFVPASNVKLFTLYAGMKYLGDSLVGLRYDSAENGITRIYPSGDPTFLASEFNHQPVLHFLKQHRNVEFQENILVPPFGYGWAWDDYKEDFMTARSAFPIYKNVFSIRWINKDSVDIYPHYFAVKAQAIVSSFAGFTVLKGFDNNDISILPGSEKNKSYPFAPDMITRDALITDTIQHISITGKINYAFQRNTTAQVIHSQASDSLFKPMMHYSDNFFAEQTLLMASNEHLGCMNTAMIIDTLLGLDLKDAPQKPKWVDGSGLSRYNLFTPQDFIYILNKMKNEFGVERMKNILATGGEGTLKNYFKKDAGFIYAKTGTLSNNCALSGYIITKKNRLLIFSILANNYQTGATPVRKAVEKFVEYLRDTY